MNKKYIKNIKIFVLIICFIAGFTSDMTIEAATSDNGKMYWAMPAGNVYNIKGYYNGALLKTTYSDQGYQCRFIVDGSEASTFPTNPGDEILFNGVKLSMNLSFVNNGYYVKVEYTVENTTGAAKTISIGSSADTMIGSNDSAPITKFSDGSGFYMTGDGAQFNFIGKDAYGVTNIDTFWFGGYSDAYNNTFTQIESNSYSGDSGMAYGWKNRTLPAYTTQKYAVLFGVGPVNKAPTITVTSPSSNYGGVNLGATLTAQGNVSDADNTTGTKVYYAIDGGALQVGYTFSGVPGAYNFNLTVPNDISPGVHTIDFVTQDTGGAMSSSVQRTFITLVDPSATLTPSSNSMNVSWQVVENATSYDVYRNGVLWQNTTNTSVNDTGLDSNTQYNYYVKAKRDSAVTTSSTVSKYTLATVPSLSVTNQTPDYTKNDLEINPNGNPAGIEYYIEYSTDNSIWTTFDGWSVDTTVTHGGLSAGTTYYYRVKARNAENILTEYSTTQTIVTNGAPVISVTSPASNVYKSEINGYTIFELSGNIFDINSDIVTITALVNGVEKSTVVNATPTDKTWSLTWDVVNDNFAEMSQTSIIVTADDGTGKSNREGSTTWTNTFYVDKTGPVKPTINTNTDWTSDASVPVIIGNGSDTGTYKSGANYTEYMLSGATEQSWTTYTEFNITNLGETSITARTVDNVGNVGNTETKIVKIDRTPSVGGSFNLNATYSDTTYTRSRTVNLENIIASDEGGSGNGSGDQTIPQLMEISNSPEFDVTSGWVPYSVTYSNWTLTEGNGTKTVYIRFQDSVGNIGLAISDTIIFDDTAPVISISTPSRYVARKGMTVAYVLTIDDETASLYGINAENTLKVELSGVGTIEDKVLEIQNAVTIENTNSTHRTVYINLPEDLEEEGTISIKILAEVAVDKAGNKSIETLGNFSLNVDSTPPTNQDILFPKNLDITGGQPVDLAKSSVECLGGEEGDSIRFAVVGYDGSNPANGATITSTHGKSKVINAPTEAGYYKLYVMDAAGNISQASTHVLSVKNIGPTVSIEGPSVTHVQASNFVEYIVTYSEDTAEITLGQHDVGLIRNGTANAYVAVSEIEGSLLQRKVTLSNLMGEGSVSIKIAAESARDEIGNVASPSLESDPVYVDNTAPVISNVTMISNNENNIELAKEGDTIRVLFTTDEYAVSPSVLVGERLASATALNEEHTSWKAEYTVPHGTSMAEGIVGFSITTVSDRAGNTSETVTDLSFGNEMILDTTPPEMTITGEKDETNSYYITPPTITFSDGTSELTNITTNSTSNPETGTSVTVAGQYSVVVTDEAGNTVEETFIFSKDYVDVMTDTENLEIIYVQGDNQSYVTRNIILPTTGDSDTTITWNITSGTSVTSDGTVTRPETDNETVTLEATVAKGEFSAIKIFNITVISSPANDTAAQVADDVAILTIEYAQGDSVDRVTQNITLSAVGAVNASDITWVSSDSETVSINAVEVEGKYSTVVTRPTFQEGNKKVVLTATGKKGEDTVEKTFNLTVKSLSGTDEEMLELDKKEVSITYSEGDSVNSVTDNISLKYTGENESTVSWSSSNTEYIEISSKTGIVTRPKIVDEDKEVTVTTVLTRGEATTEVTFQLVVKSEEDNPLNNQYCMEQDLKSLEIGYRFGDTADNLTTHIILSTLGKNGSDISWSSNSITISNDGTVTRDTEDTAVTLTATVTNGDSVGNKTFVLTVKALEVDLLHQLGRDADTTDIIFAEGDSADSVTQNMVFKLSGANGCIVSWSSMNQEVVRNEGTITTPSSPQKVTIIAAISKEGYVIFKEFEITVK